MKKIETKDQNSRGHQPAYLSSSWALSAALGKFTYPLIGLRCNHMVRKTHDQTGIFCVGYYSTRGVIPTLFQFINAALN